MAEMQVQDRLRELVAAEVRALLARRRLNGAKLATAIGRSEMYVSRRLRGETSFDIDDLELISSFLGVPVLALFPPHAGQMRTTAHYSAPAEKTMLVRSIVPAAAERMTGRAAPTQSTRQPDNGSRRVARLVTKP